MKADYRIARVWGIPIKVHITLVFLLVFFILDDMWKGFKQGDTLVRVVAGFLFSIGLFTSIALHELGHSFVAIRKGCRVREIVLTIIGGVAQMEDIPRRPMDELKMSIAGPVVNLVLGPALMAGSFYLSATREFPQTAFLLLQLGVVNLSLAAFNLLPSFPMDGGRVLRAVLTPRLGRLRATRIAATIGKFLAAFGGLTGLFGIASVLGFVGIRVGPTLAAFFPPHNWILIAIAFFVYTGAEGEYRMVRLQESARRGFGFAGWPPEAPPADPEDRVIVSPPPYEKGPHSETDVRSSDDDPPFRNIFGR